MWGGGGSKMAPPPQLAALSPKSVELPSLTTWQGLRKTPSVPQRSAKCLRVMRSVRQVCAKESHDQCYFKVISRNLFHKLGVENLLLSYCNVKVCLPLLYEL
jgi:hypothetical protein